MSNNWFRFKQFMINQEGAAMKVGTDSVLLGAWTSVPGKGRILDIGTGTGLLALMLAQRTETAEIDAVEIDEGSYIQALENINNSPWKDRIHLHHISIQDFCLRNEIKYDLIVSNPPYFSKSYPSSSSSRAIARSDQLLSKRSLIESVNRILKEDGIFSCILPYRGNYSFSDIAAEHGLHPRKILNIKPTPEKDYVRILFEFEKEGNLLREETLIIETEGRHTFSEEYTQLTKDFYLNF